MTMTETKAPTNNGVIAKFFGLKGVIGVAALKGLTAADKEQLGEGIRDGSLTY